MAAIQFFRETSLPGTLEANSIYAIAPSARPDYVELYITGTSGTTVKRVINEADVQAMIDTAGAGASALEIVDDITARDALTLTENAFVLVLDASGDETVDSGGATYAYRHSDTSWHKMSEAESMDVVLQWANIQDKPTSAVADIDDAVSKRHNHSNKTQLDKIDQDGDGNLTYDGSLPATGWDSTGW
ncbi:MAG: hypothetical protein ACQER6_09875 [Pseudomonadota bacterium]